MKRYLFSGGVLLLLAGCSAKKVPEPLPLAQSPKLQLHLRQTTSPKAPSLRGEVSEEKGAPEAAPDLQAPPSNLWDRLFSDFRFPEEDAARPEVQAQLRYFLKKLDDGFFDRVQERARPFLYHIVSEIEKAGLPGEIALLPVVESAFKPTAHSWAGAAGLWQFIPSTGKRYGLWRNFWVDLRRDPVAATRAAIQYLSELHEMFGDWYLALAAYNCGERRVQAEIEENRRRGLPTDFWHLDLPRETEAYVPRLIAVSHLFKNASRYGLALKPIPNRPLFTEIRLDGPLDLETAAELAGLSLEELYHLNAAYRRGAIPPTGGILRLPLERADRFKIRLAALPEAERKALKRRASRKARLASARRSKARFVRVKFKEPRRYRYHVVRRGETLFRIAKRYRVSVRAIKRSNHLRGHHIYPGQRLKIPVAAPKVRYHVVRRGETLFGIARRYRVSIRQLMRWNGIRSSRSLRAGQRLKLYF